MSDDAKQLRRFVEERDEDAFTALVQRHLDLVYGAALRRTGGDAHRAADVAQQVFTALARQARDLSRHTVLSAWLHTATRNLAVNLMISEQRRKTRELAAVALEPPGGAATEPAWEQVRPALDAAIDELPEPDRAAVVLRFLERRPFAEIGAVLQISADAARMRTERALEKLRTALARRGITSTATALSALVTAHSGVAAPAGLAATIAPVALGGGASAAAAAGATAIFLVSTKTILSTAGAVVALGLGFYLGFNRAVTAPLPPAPETPQQVRALGMLRKENQDLRAEVDRLTAANADLAKAKADAQAQARPASPGPRPGAASLANVTPLPALTRIKQQQAMLNNLRLIGAGVDQFQRENGRPPASLDEIVGPTKYLRQLEPVAGESYAGLNFAAKQPMTVTSPEGVAVTYDRIGSTTTDLAAASRQAQAEAQLVLMNRFGAEFVSRVTAAVQKAAATYIASNGGKQPPNPEAVLPYFESVETGADFMEFAAVAKALGMKM
jgi:RNA polymerase sigma factor (sigma-70 family)